VLHVKDTLIALQQLAASYRDALRDAGCKVIAVAGSNGKTTTRHLIHTVLSARFRGTQSPKSFNNHIGVPLTLLAASQSDDFVVVEVGTNHPGEIEALSKIVRPDIAVITSIGHEHMEFFKTLDGVAEEESAILPHVQAGGLAVVAAPLNIDRRGFNEESHHLNQFLNRLPEGVELIRYGDEAEGANLRLTYAEEQTYAIPMRFQVDDFLDLELPLIGMHNIANAMAAVAVARRLGMSDPEIAAAMKNATAAPMRMELRQFGGVTVINDAYNANPSSMKEAVHLLGDLKIDYPDQRRVLIAGDMFELGELGPDHHRDMGKWIGRWDPSVSGRGANAIHQVVLIGKLSMFTAETLHRMWPPRHVTAFPGWDDTLPEKVAGLLKAGDVVLIKGSRGMGLERLVPAIERKFGASA
jgi:UDP-N-acetylmuramoyl-tripeptide--D-alanyl-D-alanine ligase